MKKIIIISLILLSMTTLYVVSRLGSETHLSERPHIGNVYDFTPQGVVNYRSYRQVNENNRPDEIIALDVFFDYDFTSEEPEVPYVDVFTDDFGKEQMGIYTPEVGEITFTFIVNETGYYHLNMDYYSISGRGAAIARGLKLDGEYPFREAANIRLSRLWADAFNVTERREDGKNDLKPSLREVNAWQSTYLRDIDGYYTNPYSFYLTEGTHTLTLVSHREPVVINSLTFTQSTAPLSYAEMKAFYETSEIPVIDQNLFTKVQGEDAIYKSGPTLAPIADFSNHKLEPFDKKLIRYNAIGGIHWRVSGDFVEWEINAPATGLYGITLKVLQNYNRGMSSSRTLSINGVVPFAEAQNIAFGYSSEWRNVTLGNGDEPYLFYLEEGVNTMRLETTIGVYGPIVQSVEETIALLRTVYRDVVTRTGLNPDPFQDYLLNRTIPDLDDRIEQGIINLENARFDVIEIAGERSSLIASFDRSVFQLKRFLENEKNIQTGLRELEQNIAGLGTWVMQMSEQPLAIDYLIVHDKDMEVPNVKLNFFEKMWHQIVMFMESFSARDSFASSVEVDGPTITVWITTGRDQAIIIRQLIDEGFTAEQNINVNLKLVNSGVLLPATLSGNGPDISIGVGENLPVNWGIRNAILDLTTFPDFEDVRTWFAPSAITPYSFNDAVYALPDTQDFLVSFFRDDILSEIGIHDYPQTWDQVIDILPILQKNYLDYFIPNTKASLNPVLYALIEQYGGQLYLDNGASSGLLLEESQRAFVDFTRLYSDYSFVLDASFINRFRSGEMPIGVSYYTDYNTLSVFAPEINGLWSYGAIPGTMGLEGLNNTTTSRTSSTVILKNTKQPDASWEFMKWWLGKDAQLSYARNMESILGAAARYPTANLEAFDELPWSMRDYRVLTTQRENAKGIPVVPGDYIVGRYIDNAFRSALNNNYSPYDTLFVYHRKINIELERKRAEFGL